MQFKPSTNSQICVCGTLIRSKPGQTLHLKHCIQAQAAAHEGQSPFTPYMSSVPEQPSKLEQYKIEDPAFKELMDELEQALLLTERAFQNQSIHSARAARVSLMKLQNVRRDKKLVP